MNVKDSVAAKRAERAEKDAKEALSRELIDRITNELPGHIPMPVISNESMKAFLGKPGMWLSFSYPAYGEGMDPVDILQSLELAGFIPLPITLCQWDNYTPQAEPGAAEDIPEVKTWGTRMKYTLNNCEAIAPLWFDLSFPHSRFPDARTYYLSPSGLTVKVTVNVPISLLSFNGPRISARKVNHGDFATYEDVRLIFPQQWHVIHNGDYSVAERSAWTRAYRSTESSASAYLYWNPQVELSDWPLKPSEFLAVLIAKLKEEKQ